MGAHRKRQWQGAVDVTNGPSQWTTRPPLHHARVGLASATVKGQILAIGGFDPNMEPTFDFVETRRRTGDRTWHDLVALPTRRANLSAADLDGFVYAVGGIPKEGQISDAVDRYNPDAKAWGPSPKLPVGRAGAGVVGLNGLLYVAGGELPSTGPADQITDSMITYNPTNMTWTPVTSMPTKRTRFRLVAARGQLYAIGGFSEAGQALATVERYDPGSHSWDTVASMHQARVLPGAVVLRAGQRRYIVVVGGGGGQPETSQFKHLRTTEVYNMDTDRWELLKALLPHGKISLVSEVEDDSTVLAIGGAVAAHGGSATASVDGLALTDHDLGQH